MRGKLGGWTGYSISRARRASRAYGEVFEAAREVGILQGLRAVTYLSVARRCGVSKGAVQSHFKSVDELRNAVLEGWIRDLHHSVLLPARDRPNGFGRLLFIAEEWLGTAADLHLPLAHLFSCNEWAETLVLQTARGFMVQWRNICLAAVEHSIGVGESRENLTPERVVFQFQSTLFAGSWGSVLWGRRQFATLAMRSAWRILHDCAADPDASLPPLAEILQRLEARAPQEQRAIGPTSEEILEADLYDEFGIERPLWDVLSAPDDPERLKHEARLGLPLGSTGKRRAAAIARAARAPKRAP